MSNGERSCVNMYQCSIYTDDNCNVDCENYDWDKKTKPDTKNKIILDLWGGTGAWSKDYKKNGYDVKLITLPYYDILKTHISFSGRIMFQGESRMVIRCEDIYGILAAPVCTMFSFARTTAKIPRDFEKGMKNIVVTLNIIWACRYKTKLKFWALENPLGYLRQFLGKPYLTFNPTDYGDYYNKRTDIWGYFNKPCKSKVKLDRKQKALNYRNSRKLPKGKSLPERRAITPPGFAKAFYEANK